MEINIVIVRKGEPPEELTDQPVKVAEVTRAVLVEVGTSGNRPVAYLVAETEEGEAHAVVITWQLYNMINGAMQGAFGPPTAPFWEILEDERADRFDAWLDERLEKGCDDEPVHPCPHCEEPVSVLRYPGGGMVLAEGLPRCDGE